MLSTGPMRHTRAPALPQRPRSDRSRRGTAGRSAQSVAQPARSRPDSPAIRHRRTLERWSGPPLLAKEMPLCRKACPGRRLHAAVLEVRGPDRPRAFSNRPGHDPTHVRPADGRRSGRAPGLLPEETPAHRLARQGGRLLPPVLEVVDRRLADASQTPGLGLGQA